MGTALTADFDLRAFGDTGYTTGTLTKEEIWIMRKSVLVYNDRLERASERNSAAVTHAASGLSPYQAKFFFMA